jgi:hypothetical protein
MTRKDYVIIASHLAAARSRVAGGFSMAEQSAFDYTVGAVIAALAADNPRFDRTRFLAAVYGVKGGK